MPHYNRCDNSQQYCVCRDHSRSYSIERRQHREGDCRRSDQDEGDLRRRTDDDQWREPHHKKENGMASILRNVLRGEGLATKKDVNNIADKVDRQIIEQNKNIDEFQQANDERIKKVEQQNADLQNTLNELRAAVQENNGQTTPMDDGVPTDGVVNPQRKFTPKFVYARGFAQWSDGTPLDKSVLLRKGEYIQRANKLLQKLPTEFKKVARVAEPYPLSREIAVCLRW